jgi:Zn-finger nucleic acid-binding protein
MKCPACDYELRKIIAGGVAADVCVGGCGGIWFGRFEIAKFDSSPDETSRFLFNIEKTRSPNGTGQRQCPKCTSAKLLRRPYSLKKKAMVDHCPGCGGYWVDASELGPLRQEFASSEERTKTEKKYYADVFEKYLQAMRKTKK